LVISWFAYNSLAPLEFYKIHCPSTL
jgi:hypothetical protein